MVSRHELSTPPDDHRVTETDAGTEARSIQGLGAHARGKRFWRLGRGLLPLWFVIGTLLPALFGLVAGIPVPEVHDELAYVLGADTFASGRLTNPAPRLPEFFEVEHVLVVPTYNSKYPPGQALALGIGQALFGRPIWGVWLSCGLLAASLYWMLEAWVSPRWAFITTVFAVVMLGVSSYWAQSYWGGALAAAGAALLCGGLRRTLRSPRTFASALMGLGVVILAVTRPFEGALVCLAVGCVLLWWLVHDVRTDWRSKLRRWCLPFAAVLLAGGFGISLNNRAVTGQWTTLPHTLYQKQYFYQGLFLFSRVREPERRPVARVARFHQSKRIVPLTGVPLLMAAGNNFFRRFPAAIQGAIGDMQIRPIDLRHSVVLWFLALGLISLRDRWLWFCGATIVLVLLGGAFLWPWHTHYTAPIVPLVFAAAAIVMRRNAVSYAARRRVRAFAPAALVSLAGVYGLYINGTIALGRWHTRSKIPLEVGLSDRPTAVTDREDLKRRLERRGGQHLVFVDYGPSYSVHDEWVYNPADLRGAPVLFAHDLGPVKNRDLIAEYEGRTVWRARVAGKKIVAPYAADAAAATEAGK